MDTLAVSQLFALFAWFPLAILLLMMLLIARFYQRFSGRRTYFWLFSVPVVGYGLYAVRYASVEQVGGDIWGDAIGAVSGLILVVLCVRLTQLMIGTTR